MSNGIKSRLPHCGQPAFFNTKVPFLEYHEPNGWKSLKPAMSYSIVSTSLSLTEALERYFVK